VSILAVENAGRTTSYMLGRISRSRWCVKAERCVPQGYSLMPGRPSQQPKF